MKTKLSLFEQHTTKLFSVEKIVKLDSKKSFPIDILNNLQHQQNGNNIQIPIIKLCIIIE